MTAAIAREGGYDEVLMREVGNRASVAMGTLYRYFPSKPHLLLAVLENQIDRLERKTSL